MVVMRDVTAGVNRYYHLEHQGTTQALTDSTGTVTDRFACDAWGVQVKRTGSSINRQWYVGNLGYARQVDQALDYVRARYYRMAAGRFTARDPSWPHWALSAPSWWGWRLTPYGYVLN